MSDDDLDLLRQAVVDEQARRQVLDAAPKQMEDLQAQYVAALGRVDGGSWKPPTMALDVYKTGDTVTHNGKTWVSVNNDNVWEPGVEGWNVVTAPGEIEPWTPRGSTNAYMKDKRVTYQGHTWKSKIDNNVWSPTDYPGGWTDEGVTAP